MIIKIFNKIKDINMKKLIAAAVATAVIAPMTAVAAGPTLYGLVHMSVGYYDDDTKGGYSSMNVASNSSRMGIKGSEDLGNGLKVGYQYEWAVGVDGNAQDMAQRNRGITVSGGFGTALLGRWDTPMKSLGYKANIFGQRSGDMLSLTRAGTSAIDNRQNNVIAYVSPNMSGAQAKLAYVTDVTSATGDDTDNDAFSGTLTYSNGPLFLGAGYTQVMAFADDEKDYRLVASYKAGAFKVAGAYTDINNGNGVKDQDYNVWLISGQYTFGNNTIKAQYVDKSEGLSNSDDDAQNWAIALDHKMSKRTMAYVEYGQLNNGKGSALNSYQRTGSGVGMGSPAAGKDPSGLAVGIIHKF